MSALDKTYWSSNGKFQKDYDRLYEKLVPQSGKCETLEGELLRAASRISHDFYNNGFGNNWSGALEFLKKYGPIKARDYEVLREYSQGRIVHATFDENDEVMKVVESVVDTVVLHVATTLAFSKNPCDMFDLQLEDDYGYDEEDEDYGDEE